MGAFRSPAILWMCHSCLGRSPRCAYYRVETLSYVCGGGRQAKPPFRRMEPRGRERHRPQKGNRSGHAWLGQNLHVNGVIRARWKSTSRDRFADAPPVTKSKTLLQKLQKIPELWIPVPLVVCMKTNCWLNRNPLLSHLRFATAVLLACFAAVFTLATTPAAASDQVPFNGTVSGQIPSDLGPPVPGTGGCVFDFLVSNSGYATELGAFTGHAEFIPNLCDLTYTGFFYWIAANGDEISGPFSGYLAPTATPGVFDNHETAIVTHGTGRFARATGIFSLTGQVNFITSSFVLPWKGTISTVGSNLKP